MAFSSTALLLGSSLAEAVGSIFAGNAAKTAAEFEAKAIRKQTGLQAQITEEQAQREKEIAIAEEEDYRREQARLFAARRAAMGASGVRLDTGSPILAFGDFAAETELMANRIRAGGDITTARLKQQAALIRSGGRTESSLLQSAGSSAQLRGFFRASSSLLSGAGTAFA